MDLCISASHLCPLRTFNPQVEDFLYNEEDIMTSFLDDHLRPNDLLDKENELPTCTAARMKHSSKSIENEKSKADSSNKQVDAGVMSSSFSAAAVIDER